MEELVNNAQHLKASVITPEEIAATDEVFAKLARLSPADRASVLQNFGNLNMGAGLVGGGVGGLAAGFLTGGITGGVVGGVIGHNIGQKMPKRMHKCRNECRFKRIKIEVYDIVLSFNFR